jgi:hypothetical protein
MNLKARAILSACFALAIVLFLLLRPTPPADAPSGRGSDTDSLQIGESDGTSTYDFITVRRIKADGTPLLP